MSTDTLLSKIDLLQEQIDNFEKSGFFTDAEIDRLSSPLHFEIKSLKNQLTDPVFNIEVIDAEILTPNNIKA